MTEAVVGIGNPLVGDDGVGAVVVDHLDEEIDGPVRHTGTSAFLALEVMDGADRAVLVDAVDLTEPPGTVVRLPFDGETFAGKTDVTLHDVSVAEALRVGETAYDLPRSVWLVGVVPASLEPGVGLSPVVHEQVPEVADRVRETLADPTPGEMVSVPLQRPDTR